MTCVDHPAPSPKRKVDWPRAWRAVQKMRADPQRTDRVFEMSVALDGGDSERHFQGFLAEPGARGLLEDRPELLDALADFGSLRGLPSDSLGAAYLKLMERNGLTADGLRREAAKVEQFSELHPGAARRWFADRANCVHDLLHVVTGYGQDPAGETTLLAFTDGLYGRRFRMRVIRFGMVASLLSAPRRSRWRAVVFARRARRRGLRAKVPFSYPWEAALARPLCAVRDELGIEQTDTAHPRGILQGGVARGPTQTPWSLGAAIT